jgi:hypothetical protein
MLTNEMKEKIMAIAEEYEMDYEYIGIRFQEQEFELGELDHASSVWVDGEETDEEMDGVSVIDVRKLGVLSGSNFYDGDHIAVIGGNSATYGEDLGELVIEDPVVIEIIQ